MQNPTNSELPDLTRPINPSPLPRTMYDQSQVEPLIVRTIGVWWTWRTGLGLPASHCVLYLSVFFLLKTLLYYRHWMCGQILFGLPWPRRGGSIAWYRFVLDICTYTFLCICYSPIHSTVASEQIGKQTNSYGMVRATVSSFCLWRHNSDQVDEKPAFGRHFWTAE